MKKNYLTFFALLFIFSACQTTKTVEDQEDSLSPKERIAIFQEKWRSDSLQRAFCKCLVEDSISSEERLKRIDEYLAQKIDITQPCSYDEKVHSFSAGTALINLGVKISNTLLRTRFSKRQHKSETVYKDYPVLVVFSEDTTMIRELVKRGADLNQSTEDKFSITELYVMTNDTEKVQFILDLGAIPEKINIHSNNEKMIDFLLEKGAKTENIDKAVLFESNDYEKLATKYNIDLKTTTCKEFNSIVRVGNFKKLNFERTEWLLKNSVSSDCMQPRFVESVVSQNVEGRVFGSQRKTKKTDHTEKEWIDLLNTYKVNWNQCTTFGKTPLALVVEKQNLDLIQNLLEHGAKPTFTCQFAAQERSALKSIEQKIESSKKSEQYKKERDGDKYSEKDAATHTKHLEKLYTIQKLLESY